MVWYANTSITLEDIVSVLVTNTRFISSFGISDPCRSSIYRIYCHSFLRECVTQNNSDGSVTYLPYPIESCRDICTTYGKYILSLPLIQLIFLMRVVPLCVNVSVMNANFNIVSGRMYLLVFPVQRASRLWDLPSRKCFASNCL